MTIHSGIIVSEWLRIESGDIATDTTVNSGGSMSINQSGSANGTTVNSGGSMSINQSGSANGTTVNSGGCVNIWLGGSANSTTVNSGGSMTVNQGGTVSNTTIYSNGCMSVYSSGSANNTTIYSGGNMTVYWGGSANNTTINSGGCMTIYRDGSANNTTVYSGAYMYIYTSGIANSTFINSGGCMDVSSGASTNNTSIYSDGYMHISSGGSANYTTVYSGGCMRVFSGGFANNTTIKAGGIINGFSLLIDNFYSTGIYISNAIVSESAYLYSKQSANSTSISSGGCVYVSNGSANNTTVNSGGCMSVYISGTTNSTSINSGGCVYISSGSANNTTVNAGGSMTVYWGGSANNTTVNSGGCVYISGGSANNITVKAGGTINGFSLFTDNFYLMGIHHISNAIVLESTNLRSGQTTNNTIINSGGYMHISSGGSAHSTTVNSSGYMRISSGGSGNDTTVNSGGYMTVPQGSANNTTVNSGGHMIVSRGGSANSTTINSGGYIDVYDGGSVNSTSINSGGYMDITADGSANSTSIKEGGIINGFSLLTENFYSTGIHISNAIVSGSAYLCSEQTANSTTINSGGCITVYQGGTANSTSINSGGCMTVFYSSGLASNTTVYSGGYMHISSGGFVSSTTAYSGGYMTIDWGGSANNTSINSGGCMTVCNGGFANSTSINSGGYMTIDWGGTANSTSIKAGGIINGFSLLTENFYSTGIHISNAIVSGSAHLRSEQTANSTFINSGGYMTVDRGGTANNTSINSGGCMTVDWGGTVNSTSIKAGGIINGFSLLTENFYSTGIHISNAIVSGSAYLRSEQTANNTSINSGGCMTVDRSGAANSTTINSGGYMTVSADGSVNNTSVKVGGIINGFSLLTENFYSTGIHISNAIVSGSAYLRSEQTANNTSINSGGCMTVDRSGAANSTTINSGGSMTVYSSGSASNTTVFSGGSMTVDWGGSIDSTTVYSGGYLTVLYKGNVSGLTVLEGGTVLFASNSRLNLNISEKTASGDYLIAGTVTGTPSYTITVSENQTAGTYKLVRKLPEFIASVTLNGEGENIGTLYTNGASVSYNGNRYSLVYEDSSLSLVVTETYTPPADTEAPTSPGNLSITVSADSAELHWTPASDNIAVTGYRLVLDNGSAINLGSVLSYTIQNPSAGNHTVRLAAYDAAGNIGNYTSATFLVESATPEPTPDPTPTPDPIPTPEPGLPAAPDGAAVAVKKYNAKFFWNKYSAEKGVKVKYQIMVDGTVQGKLSSGNSYTLKNAGVGNHTFAVRAVLSEKGREDVYTAWSGNVVQYVADVTAPKTGKLALAQTGEDSLRAEWNAANDNVGIARYVVTCGGVTREFDGSVLSAGFSGLAGKVTAEITAYDAAGNAGKTVRKNLKMNDMTAPDQVTGLRSEGVDNKSGGILAWNAASDNVGVTRYEIAIDGGKTFKSKTNSVKIKKMAAGTYRYTVVALDKAKNRSIVSQEGEFTVADVINPKIKKLSCKVNGQTAFVSWNATDEVGIARSELWLDGARYADTTGLTSFSLGSLELGQHSVELKVWDAAGNDVFKAAKCNVTTPDQGLMTAAETSLFRGDVSRNSGMIASL